MTPGTKLGPYEIIAPIGAGGMGEVYRARDTKLDRDVAIKVLPTALAQHPDRLARFEREAKVLAALNHPNIAGIYGLEDRAIVMELVEGPTLADRLAAGAIPIDESLKIAAQIADALEAAHEKGVVHRDLKPANVKVREDGTVKVLDFGLATAVQSSAGERSDGANSPTLTMGATEVGVILGTASYMSPEQAAGKPVDRRADIWSFGVVLWEMLTGKRLFEAESVSHTLADVLRAEIDFGKLPAATPAAIRELLKRCLDRDLKNRLQAIGEARITIQKYLANPKGGTEVPQRAKARPTWAVTTALFALAAFALAFVHFRETLPEERVVRTTILPPDKTEFVANGLGVPALSPDGRKIVLVARTPDGKSPLWVRSLDGLAAQPLAGTEGAASPFWSPDGKFIAFFADDKLKKIDASGGPSLTLTDAPTARGGSWSPEGMIVFAVDNGGRVERVSMAGGTAVSLSIPPGRWPWFLPDGRHFLYSGQPTNGQAEIRVASLDAGPPRSLGEANSNAVYAQDHLLFLREGTLMAQPFDTKHLAAGGEAVPFAEQVESLMNTRTLGVFSVSENGLLVYRSSVGQSGEFLTWVDRSGKPAGAVGQAANFVGELQFSLDRKRLAIPIMERGISNIWIYDVSRGMPSQFTFDATVDRDPVWSPDGRTIVFATNRKGHYDLYKKPVDSPGAEELLYADNSDKFPTSWSADGKFLLYFTNGLTFSKTEAEIWALPITSEHSGSPPKPFPVVAPTASSNSAGTFSPDSRWVAYFESRSREVYVTPFPPLPSGPDVKWRISAGGGIQPRWRQDGKEIFYAAPDGRLMAAELAIKGGTPEVVQIRALFTRPNGSAQFDVSLDGQRFLFVTAPELKSSEPLTLIQNWAAGLKK